MPWGLAHSCETRGAMVWFFCQVIHSWCGLAFIANRKPACYNGTYVNVTMFKCETKGDIKCKTNIIMTDVA